MKKVLSVLLAAAMVMGMSVAAFAAADKPYGVAGSAPEKEIKVDADKDKDGNQNTISFVNAIQVRDGRVVTWETPGEDKLSLEAGDVLYFEVGEYNNGKYTEYTNAAGVPSNWVLKMKDKAFIDDATLYAAKADDNLVKNNNNEFAANRVYVKVTLESDVDFYEEDDVEFYFYIYDRTSKNSSERAEVKYTFANYGKETLTEDDLDWVITVKKPTTFTYKKGEKSAYGTFDFNNGAFAEFKLYSEEKYTLSTESKYNKTLSKEYDTDVEVMNFRLKNVDNVDLVFEAAKDNKQIVAVVDGELIPVEAEYVKDYKFSNGTKINGYLVENAEYTQYAVIDADVEIDVEEEVKDTETTTEANKANPETGAADFVGAAVALAVVSVAAAGALALKK